MQTEIFRALGDDTRFALFRRITRQEQTVTELTAFLKVSQPAVSQHLNVLKRCGVVSERRAGRFVHYRARPEGLRPLMDWLAHYRTFWPERLAGLEKTIKEMGDAER